MGFMDFISKFKLPEQDDVRPLPKPAPVKEPEPEPEQPSMEQLLEMMNMRATYGEILGTFYMRHFLTRCDFGALYDLCKPPMLHFDSDFETFKILPDKQSNPANMERLWNNLRMFKHPIAFELISKPESMYFCMSVAKRDAPTLERQLRLHFPEATVTPGAQHELAHELPYCARSYAPEHSTFFLEHKGQFQDPYTPLFSFMDEQAELDRQICIQFICHPLPEAGIVELCKLLKWEQPGLPLKVLLDFEPDSYWRNLLTNTEKYNHPFFFKEEFLMREVCDKIEELYESDQPFADKIIEELQKQRRFKQISFEQEKRLAKKMPPWVMCVNVFGQDKEEVVGVGQNFLSVFETREQKWKMEKLPDYDGTEDTNMQHHKILHWNIISTEELVTVAHFPSGNASSDRLETSSDKKSAPPDEYTMRWA